jgi:hypothetical protein
MKILSIILACLLLESTGCTKNNNKENCTTVTVTQNGTICNTWGIKSGTTVYPAGNIPDQFKQEGLQVCAIYELYVDQRFCACCGGTWANIITMK